MSVVERTRPRTNETEGTRATLRNLRTSAYKVREVLKLIRGKNVEEARSVLRFASRGSAEPVLKLLNSAVANAVENDSMEPGELYVSSCYADEGVTMKRHRPRAKGRASRIRKRGSHVTIIVSRMSDEEIARLESKTDDGRSSRNRRVAGSRAGRVAKSKQAHTDAPQASEEEANDSPVVSAQKASDGVSDADAQTAASADSSTDADEAEKNDSKEEGK